MSHGNNNIYLSKTISQRLCLHDFSVLVAGTSTVQREKNYIKIKQADSLPHFVLDMAVID